MPLWFCVWKLFLNSIDSIRIRVIVVILLRRSSIVFLVSSLLRRFGQIARCLMLLLFEIDLGLNQGADSFLLLLGEAFLLRNAHQLPVILRTDLETFDALLRVKVLLFCIRYWWIRSISIILNLRLQPRPSEILYRGPFEVKSSLGSVEGAAHSFPQGVILLLIDFNFNFTFPWPINWVVCRHTFSF